MIEPNKLSPFKHFCMTIGALPTSYKESLTYYEMLEWLCNYLANTVVPAVDNNANALEELQNYVQHYFDNLDVQQEIDNKLDEMAESGQLAELVAQYLDLGALLSFDTLADMKAGTNFKDGSNIRIMGKDTYDDGKGTYYHVRPIVNTDDIDNYHIVALTNYPTLVAELVEDNVKQPATTGIEVAHRGCPEDCIENTITSFEYAYNKGFKFIETDVQLTTDKYMVLFHDAQVDTKTDGTGTVNDLTYSYLRGLTYTQGGNIAAYPDTHINDIDELLSFLKQHDIKCWLEIKEIWDNESLKALYDKVQEANLQNQIYYMVYRKPYGEYLRKLDKKVQIGVIESILTDEVIDYCYQYNLIPCIFKTGLDINQVKKAHSKGLAVYGWTIASASEYQIMLNKNIDYMATDSRLYCYVSTNVPLGKFNYIYPYYSKFDKYLLEHGYTLLNYSVSGFPYMVVTVGRAVSIVKIPVKAGDVLNFSFDNTKYSLSIHTMSTNGTTSVDSGWLTGTSYTITGANSKWCFCYFKKNDGTNFKDYELDEVGTIANNISITRS